MPETQSRAHEITGTTPQAKVLTVPLVAVALGMFMMQLDATVANLALPKIGADLHSSLTGLQWVIDAYTLPLASVLLIGGRLGDRVGHRNIFIIGLMLFGLGSLGCALSVTTATLVAARAVQGVGAALELPASLALLARNYPDPKLRAKAIGIWASVGGLALAVGPLAGGRMVDSVGWQSIFVLNLPIVVAGIALTLRSVPGDATRASIGLDVPGQITATVFLAALTYAVIEYDQLRNHPLWLGIVCASGATAFVAFLLLERHSQSPLIPGNVLHHTRFMATTFAALGMGYMLFSILFIFSLYFQRGWHESASTAGDRLLPLALAFVLTGPIADRLGARQRPTTSATIGLTLLAAGCCCLAFVPTTVNYWLVATIFAGIGFGYGLLSTTLAIVAVGTLPPHQHGLGSSLNNTARQLGGVLGVAIAGHQIDFIHAPRHNWATNALLTGATIALIAVIVLAAANLATRPKPTVNQ